MPVLKVIVVISFLALIGIAVYVGVSSDPSAFERAERTDANTKDQDRRQQRFDRAIEKLQVDERDQEALEEIRRLTLAEPVFLPAHRFAINYIVRKNQVVAGSSAMEQLKTHLKTVSDGGDDSAKAMLAQLYVADSKNKEAIFLLRGLVRKRPDLSSLLSRLLILQGDKEEAIDVTNRAIDHYQEKVSTNPSDDAARLKLAVNLGILERYSEAVAVLRERINENPQLRESMIRYAMKEVDATMVGNRAEAFSLLQQSIGDCPSHVAPWSRMVRLSRCDDVKVAAQALSVIEDSSSLESTEGKLALVLGAQAHVEGNLELAVEYLEQAYDVSPKSADIVNNLASYLSQANPPQLDRAIRLANDLVAQNSERVEFRETRGQILALLGRDEEAIADLEKAFAVMPKYQPLVTTLASLYEKTGNPSKAAAFLATANRNRDKQQVDLRGLLDEILSPLPVGSSPKTVGETEWL